MKSLLKYGLAIVPFFTTLLLGQAAFAAPPEDIVGTWNGLSGNPKVITDIRVTVAEQQPDNPAQVSECRSITGDMSVNTRVGPLNGSMQGYYCPATGAFAFILNRKEDGATMQLYRGNISDDGKSMKGTFFYISGD
ncbi:hypothetical protein [uncultured Nostoc sp.]|uniref:hypothetical protein n=1 Tax=uncultured Nostoc sp. TaxID=340711 RepID=UPI0035CC9189